LEKSSLVIYAKAKAQAQSQPFRQVRGVRIDHVHLVVDAHAGVLDYPVEFDAIEFCQRSNCSALQSSGRLRLLASVTYRSFWRSS
jgi:hypothetical protein